MILKLDNQRLKRTRLLAGMTGVGLARKAGISEDYLFKIEKGERNPRPDVVKSLADAIGCDVLDIAEVVGVDGSSEGNPVASDREQATG
jgi:transcriptional regulator with XRE-family HTH domain